MVLKPFGGRWLSIYGFWLNAIGFAGLAICFELEPGTGASATNTTTAPSSVYLASYGPIGGMDVPGLDVGLGAGAGKGGGPDLKWVKFAAFCLLNFALNWGPNISTYVLPATVYPQKVRSTFHGLSASCGKVGAVVGTFMFPVIHTYYGIAAVLWVQVACSVSKPPAFPLACLPCLPACVCLCLPVSASRTHARPYSLGLGALSSAQQLPLARIDWQHCTATSKCLIPTCLLCGDTTLWCCGVVAVSGWPLARGRWHQCPLP